jgi:CBS domain-containing protein
VVLFLFGTPRRPARVAGPTPTAAILRRYLIGEGPLFPTPPHAEFIGPAGFLGCILIGFLAAGLSMMLTTGVYAAEDAFQLLPIHWMWWPAIGGFVIGIGGLIFPEALGVGYGVIGELLQGDASNRLIIGILLVKSLIWIIALGSGTSGGVLAPLLMMGGALGAAAANFLPNEGTGFWPLIAMAAILGGTMRSPFTAAIFALELTRDTNSLLPLLIAVTVAHGVTSIALKRSILSEKISRRGFHVSRDYAIDPLELLFVREVMRTNVAAVPFSTPVAEFDLSQDEINGHHAQRLYPIVDDTKRLIGVVPRHALEVDHPDGLVVGDVMLPEPVVAYPDEILRVVVNRMAETGLTRFPVVEGNPTGEVLGMISLEDLLKARVRNLEAERRRERVLPASFFLPRAVRRGARVPQ